MHKCSRTTALISFTLVTSLALIVVLVTTLDLALITVLA